MRILRKLTALLVMAMAVTLAPSAPATAATGDWMSVTWQKQQTGYWCGPAAIRMAISARTSSLPTQAAIAARVGTTPDAGTNRFQVRDGLNGYLNSRYQVFNVNNPMTPAQLDAMWGMFKRNVGINWATPVNIVTRPGGVRPPGYAASTNVDHWVVVTGWSFDGTNNYVHVHDPASGSAGFNSSPTWSMTLWSFRQLVTKTYVA